MALWMVIPIVFMGLMLWCLYVHIHRIMRWLEIKDKWQRGIAIVVSVVILLPVVVLWGGSGIVAAIVIVHFCAFLLLFDLVNVAVCRIGRKKVRGWEVVHKAAVLPVICTVVLMVYGNYNIKNVVETEYNVSTEKEIRDSGYKVAVLSDIHYGLLDNCDEMKRIADKLSEKKVDLVLLCGDIVDESTSLEELEEFFAIFGKIRSNFGVYFVYGNHDMSLYTNTPNYTRDELDSAIVENGIRILADEVVQVTEDLLLVGRQDRSFDRQDVEELIKGVDKSQYIVLMDHQPYELSEKAEAGVDLQISGHTHAGQLFPVGIFNSLNRNSMNYGIKRFGEMQSVVTSGVTGWGFPIRTQGHSEYVIINIAK